MAYFNHAFNKCFVGTAGFTGKAGGMLGTAGNILAAGEFAFVDPTNWDIMETDGAPTDCCPLILASGSLYTHDTVGSHGGYHESNKSKMINPKYVSKWYKVEACGPQAAVLNVGSTNFTLGGGVATFTPNGLGTGYTDVTDGLFYVTGGSGEGMVIQATVTGGVFGTITIVSTGNGYTAADVVTVVAGDGVSTVDETITIDTITSAYGDGCCCEFLCDETYNLRLDVKGSPALRFLNHQAYKTLDAYTGCCPDGAVAPVLVDSTLVYIAWANGIVEDAIMSNFVYPVVYDETGVAWYPPGTDAAFLASVGADTWDNYVSAGHIADACAGMSLTGAYIDTRFGDCTFQVSDFYEKEPLRLYASEVDLNGDPCEFAGCCVVDECLGSQAMGLGESVARDVIMSESYRQNFFHSDMRIREITQGDQILNTIDRTASYDRYYIQHHVPRFNNPTGTFDNDQYLLDIIIPTGAAGAATAAAFEAFMNTWIVDSACSPCGSFEVISCLSDCTSTTVIPPVV